MKNFRYILVLVTMVIEYGITAQTISYSVESAPFSTLTNDEFSPVYYKNGIVFCSNLKNNSVITYQSEMEKLFNIFFIEKKDSANWKNVNLFAKELTTNYNDGPATFNEAGNIIYFCRNNEIREQIKDISDTTNRLGIYSAELADGKWTNIRPFTYNNPLYSFGTPSLTYDGNRLYFASDLPGGYGGFDLYYCNRKENDWEKPVNLGPLINTSKNESYPFAGKSGKLYFSSDGHPGFGKKDLYYSQEIEGKWINPIHLDAEINSPFDDFGLVTDENFENGFFSSNRRKTNDIYSFVVKMMEFPKCDSMIKNNYCFLFYDEFHNENDSIPVKYVWDFGNGIKKAGIEVKHCLPGPGNYNVKLNIMDSIGDTLIGSTSYEFELKDINQVYINSPDAAILDNPVLFDGLKTNLPGFNISDYVWDFGEGFKARGPSFNKSFEKKGEYVVKLGLLGEKDSLGNISKTCVYKKIRIFEDYQELAIHFAKEIDEFEETLSIETKKKSGHDSVKFIIKSGDLTEGLYSLIIKIYLLDEISEPQKKNIYENLNETNECVIEMNDTGIEPASFPVLLKFIEVLKQNPGIKLEIAVHTGEKGLPGNNLEISEKWANNLYSYFFNNGIIEKNLHCKGYGESRPIVTEKSQEEFNLSGRIEFIFINNSK